VCQFMITGGDMNIEKLAEVLTAQGLLEMD
jgi:hypothetical protein